MNLVEQVCLRYLLDKIIDKYWTNICWTKRFWISRFVALCCSGFCWTKLNKQQTTNLLLCCFVEQNTRKACYFVEENPSPAGFVSLCFRPRTNNKYLLNKRVNKPFCWTNICVLLNKATQTVEQKPNYSILLNRTSPFVEGFVQQADSCWTKPRFCWTVCWTKFW